MQTKRTLDEFRNEPFTDFSKPENAEAMRAAIEQVRSELGREYKNWVNGEWITLDSKFSSFNPSNKTEVIATLKTLGASRRTIMATYAIQIGVLTALGLVIGLVLGALVPLIAGPIITANLASPETSSTPTSTMATPASMNSLPPRRWVATQLS